MIGEQNDSVSDFHVPMKNEHDKDDLNQDESAMIPLVTDPLVNSKNNECKPNGLHTSPSIYREDVVRHKNTGVIGIVSEVAGESDSDSSITDDEDDDDDNDEDVEGEADGGGDRNRGGDNDENGSLQADHVRVIWMGGGEPIQDIHNVTLIDRAFLHGDYVASASDPTGQIGVVVDVNIFVDLLAPDGSIKKNVSSRSLKRVRDYAVGDYVILGPWLGRVDDVLDNVTVLFDDGSQCKVTKAEPTHLKPVSKTNFEDDGHFPYYPGQRVRGISSSVFKNSRWLSGLWKANRLEGTVTKVTVGSVFIYWITSAGYGHDSSTTPAEEQRPNNLRLLSCLTHANWQVGDWCLLPQSSSSTIDKKLSKLGIQDSVKSELDSSQPESGCDSEGTAADELGGNDECMDFDPVDAADVGTDNTENSILPESSSCASPLSVPKEPTHETGHHPRKKIRRVVVRRDKKARKNEEIFEKALLIFNTRTKVDVAWQDGMVDHGRDSTTLIPIDNPGDHEFVAEQYVVEKAYDDDDDDGEDRRVGVVKSVDAKEKTACVKWLKPVARAEDPREFHKEDIVSVYELEGHPDYDYCYGDVVVRLSPVTVSHQIVSAVESEEQNAPNKVKQDGEMSLGHKKTEHTSESCMDFADLTWVGNITGLTNGDIEVAWADGMVSTVGPQAVYVVGRDDDDDESVAAGSEVSDDAISWETVNDEEINALENSQEEFGMGNPSDMNPEVEESVENNSGRSVPFSLPVASAIGLVTKVTRLASGIFSWGRRNVDDAALEELINISSYDESSSQESNIIGKCDEENTHAQGEVGTESANVEEALSSSKAAELNASAYHKGEASSFKHFDIAKDPLDHYFLGSNGQVSNNRKWLKKVQKDWIILQSNLPNGIYVRAYEDRMDLIRAVIVGAYGTPYQDGLFFFDFHLPPEYPDVPPSAYYQSGGWRINPNLYEEGKVCLSLLNTWTGKGNEVWDPTSSSILQVLVSLQGLVLNARPYFNEAGYDRQIGTAEGEKNSFSYNENSFLLNCKTMMYLMRRTPKDFEELVKDHFRRRGYYILKACDAYMKGHLIGSLAKDASIGNDAHANSTSVGFKLGLKRIVSKLYLALTEAGADCNEFAHLQQS
ncbi:ubiquitin-conjugating enzyme E2 23 isoform X2 [Tripterygium wilfordii]|uniref:E2 ubiquitin-conjugating enzyme n=1 Tax=Tripterygium wilfordii TaxID=458696 RepID=A0A7J7DH15_TRIWF|nr:probable ubiquitin-conjugating enzyme E2 23 isoform X2 [Tripterygium wilfordii]KAF5745346.1 ubiquitin-conjugating enzyme E2 23 isoform X2 [Tripterygium wilfordii]